VAHKLHPEYINKTLRQIASENNKTPAQMLSIVAKESFELSQGASAIESIIGKSMDEKDVLALLNWEYSNVTTDGGLDCLHPRGCGSFTKVIDDYIGDEGLGSIERVIHKMTGLTAKNLGIQNRGEIRVGSYADLILFEPDQIQDNATYEQPNLLSDGIHSVWVNGKRVLEDGELTGSLPGKIILREVN
jgi:N-acyl-D-amino-acid deacylase